MNAVLWQVVSTKHQWKDHVLLLSSVLCVYKKKEESLGLFVHSDNCSVLSLVSISRNSLGMHLALLRNKAPSARKNRQQC